MVSDFTYRLEFHAFVLSLTCNSTLNRLILNDRLLDCKNHVFSVISDFLLLILIGFQLFHFILQFGYHCFLLFELILPVIFVKLFNFLIYELFLLQLLLQLSYFLLQLKLLFHVDHVDLGQRLYFLVLFILSDPILLFLPFRSYIQN